MRCAGESKAILRPMSFTWLVEGIYWSVGNTVVQEAGESRARSRAPVGLHSVVIRDAFYRISVGVVWFL